MYSGMINLHISGEYKFGLKVTDSFCVKLAEITHFCKITSTSSCLVYGRVKYYLCWSSRSVWVTDASSDVWIQWCRHKVTIISISCTVELVTSFVILMICFICEYQSWSETIVPCYTKQSAARNISRCYIFPRIHFQEEESSRQDLQSICRSLDIWF